MNVDEMPAGQAMNLLVAEKVMRWTWIQPPQWDYNGPLPEQGLILAPPGFEKILRTGWKWPNKGVITADYLLHEKYSSDIAHAWMVVERLRHWSIVLRRCQIYPEWSCAITGFRVCQSDVNVDVIAETAPLAICRAALKAMGEL